MPAHGGREYTGFMLAFDVEWGIPLLLIVVLIFFGGAKIPQLARSLGSAQREFKKGLDEGDDEDDGKKKGGKHKAAPAKTEPLKVENEAQVPPPPAIKAPVEDGGTFQ